MARKWTIADIPPQAGRLAVVTGGNRGLGLEIVEDLAKAGAHVVIAPRDIAKAEAAASKIKSRLPAAEVEAMQLDQSDFASTRRFSDEMHRRFDRPDMLIHNASAILVTE